MLAKERAREEPVLAERGNSSRHEKPYDERRDGIPVDLAA